MNTKIYIPPRRKTVVLLFVFLVQHTLLLAQESFYDHIPLGTYQVALSDTTIYDKNYQYEAYAYKGVKPCFLKIWCPLGKQTNELPFLKFSDLLETKTPPGLESIGEQLEANNREIITRDFIDENFETGESNSFGEFSNEDIFELIRKVETRSVSYPVSANSAFPVIIYHHGSQSNSFDNFLMAEYFASRGFIFVAANFHLPYENTLFGLKPFDKLVQSEEENSLKTVFDFATSLTTSSSIFFIGHSWGAQMGFRTWDEDPRIKALVSLETTLEFKENEEQIKEFWPEVYQKIAVEKACYPFPVMLCAATGKDNSFDFLQQLKADQISFVSTRVEFDHNAYTSLFYLRYFIENQVPQADYSVLKDSFGIYVGHLEFIHDYFGRILNKNMNLGIEKTYIGSE